MHFSLLEKLGAAALICAWLIYGANFLGSTLVQVQPHAATVAAAPTEAEPSAEATAPAVETDLGTLLAAATPEQGEKVFGRCKACHTIEKGGRNGVGPNMWNVVGGPKAHIDGFAYSEALASRHAETWSYENLDGFLANPKEYLPGTKMTFAGLRDPEDRAAVIIYMKANTESPPPLPEPKPTATTAEAIPAQMPAATSASPEPTQTAAATSPEAPEAAPADPATLVAAADAAAGEKVFGRCKACHTVDKGGRNGVGPNLWDIVNAKKAHLDNFSYSASLAGMGGQWTYANLYAFLENPKSYVPGTKMAFAGLRKSEDRADVIAYMRTLSDQPAPLP